MPSTTTAAAARAAYSPLPRDDPEPEHAANENGNGNSTTSTSARTHKKALVKPAVYYNEGPFDPPSSVSGSDLDEDDATLLNKEDDDLDVGEGDALIRGRDEEDRPGYFRPSASPSKPRSPLRYLILSLAALVLLLALIAVFTAFSYPTRPPRSPSGRRPITLEHIFNGTFYPLKRSVNWVPEAGDGVYSINERGSIELHDLKTNETTRLLKFDDVRDENGNVISWTDWKLSPDMKYVLVQADYKKQWRWSSHANYYIHRLSDHTTYPVAPPSQPPKIAYATWSPTGEAIAFVSENDLYVLPSASPSASPIRITTTGNASLFYGVPDWVYEEEVFSADSALWWSPDARRLAFLRLDETDVPDYTYPVYNPSNNADEVHPYTEFVTMKYPKPGYPNPLVEVWVFDLEAYMRSGGGAEVQVQVHADEEEQAASVRRFVRTVDWPGRRRQADSVITEIAWVANASLLVREVNRAADDGVVVVVMMEAPDAQAGADAGILRATPVRRLGRDGEQGDEGWIDNEQYVYPLPESLGLHKGAYLDIVPTKDGYNQIALFDSGTATVPRWLTKGEDEVVEIYTVDAERRLVYYLVATDKGIGRRVYAAEIPGANDPPRAPYAIPFTDDWEADPDPDMDVPGSYFEALFSPQAGFYLLSHRGPQIPWQKMIKVGDPSFTQDFTTNEHLNRTVKEYLTPAITYSTMDSEGYELNTREILPPNMDLSGHTKYPVLFEVYGGPGSQKVDTKFNVDWHHFLASELNYIVVSVDGRGTGFKGRKLRRVVKGNLGFWETRDQIAGARLWANKSYVDADRIGVWGWSYGGFMAAKVVEADAGVHSLAMSVAPVISWRMYDTIYTERYMGVPDDNPNGYVNASISNVQPFNNFSYLLAHGSGDDNVHYANTAHLLDMFTQHHVQGDFQFRMFTDSAHSMATRGANRAVYEFLTSFLTQHWGKNGAKREGIQTIYS